mgnify:CR=1 FL=1
MDLRMPDAGENSGVLLRRRIHGGQFTDPTVGAAPGHVQGNLVILPSRLAHDFLRFCQLSFKPCPVIGLSEPGSRDPADRQGRRNRHALVRHLCRAGGGNGADHAACVLQPLVLQSLAKKSMGCVALAAFPFFIGMNVMVAIVFFFLDVVTWLPNQMLGQK